MRKALVIGINDYPQCPLRGCINDAVAINSVLESNGDGAPNFSVKLITSAKEQISRATLRSELQNLFAGDPDIALFYFSGHGFVNSVGGYIVTADFQKYDEGIPMDEILRIANNSEAKEKVIILDCCHSGALGVPTGGAVTQLTEGLTVLTASRAAESALEVNGCGIFTSLVVSALQGGAADLRGHVTPGSIYSYVDQALGPWDQRPMFKTNVSRFTSLRSISPRIPPEILRKLIEYFPTPQQEHKLDPAYEDTSASPDKTKVAVFKNLQRFTSVGLVMPVGEDHMYYAAMNSKTCKLTSLGLHYWRLLRKSGFETINMQFFSASELAANGSHRVLNKSYYTSANAIMANEAREYSYFKTYDIFLSHSFLDANIIYGLKSILEEASLSVYVYWIEDAAHDSTVTSETADRIRNRMQSCRGLLYATSENAAHSKWMPWELGYFDGKRGKVAICPITTAQTFDGREYVGLYPIMEKDLWLHKSGALFKKLPAWLAE